MATGHTEQGEGDSHRPGPRAARTAVLVALLA